MRKFILFTAVLFSVAATAQHNIVYNLEKAGIYAQNQTVVSEQNQIINGMPQKVNTSVSTESDYVVRDIKDGIYYIDIIVKKMSNTTKTAMGTETIASDGPVSNPMNKLFSNMIKDPIKITMDRKGNLLSFDNSAQLENITEGVVLPDMQLAQLEGTMKKEMSAEKQIVNYSQLTQILPENEISVGASWDKKVTINSIGQFESTTSFTLESVTDAFFTISAIAEITTPENEEANLMGMNATYNLAGPLKGIYIIDKKTGWISTANLEQQLDGTIIFQKSEIMPQEMKILMTSKTITTIR
jgi:hypothetical protein